MIVFLVDVVSVLEQWTDDISKYVTLMVDSGSRSGRVGS